jgi:hypothetical protein
MLKPDESPDGLADQLLKLVGEAQDANGRVYAISSLAVDVRHILQTTEDRDAQPMVSAVELCCMIENLVQEEANQADLMHSQLMKLRFALAATEGGIAKLATLR